MHTIANKGKRLLTIVLFATVTMALSATDKVVRKQNDGTYVVNTKTIAKDVKGYSGTVPLEIYVRDNKIVKILALTNYETRSYFDRVKKFFFPKWVGMTVKEAAKADVDGVTGATVTCNAVKENIHRGMKYFKKNKNSKR